MLYSHLFFWGLHAAKVLLELGSRNLFAGSTVCQAFLLGAHLEQNAGNHRKARS